MKHRYQVELGAGGPYTYCADGVELDHLIRGLIDRGLSAADIVVKVQEQTK